MEGAGSAPLSRSIRTISSLAIFVIGCVFLFPISLQAQLECDHNFVSFEDALLREKKTRGSPRGQYLIPALNFSCDGYVSGLTFGVRVPRGGPREKRVFLQIWRPSPTPTYTLVKEITLSTSLDRRPRGQNEDKTIITHYPGSLIAVSSGDAIGYSVVGEMEALQVVTATVSASNNINGVIYSTKNNEESDEVEHDSEDSDGTNTRGRTINLDDDGNFVLSTAAFSPLINVFMTSQTAAPVFSQSSLVLNVDSMVPITPSNDNDVSKNGIPIIIGVIAGLGIVVAGLMIFVVCLAVWKVKKSKGLCKHSEDTIALGHGSTLSKDEQPEYSYIAVDDLKVPLPATGKGYEQVTHHRELNQGAMISPVTGRNEDSIVSQYYSFLSDPAVIRENANVTYQYVPSSFARQEKVLEAPLAIDIVTHTQCIGTMEQTDTPYSPPSIVLDELYDQLAYRKCLEIPRMFLKKNELLGGGEFGEVFKGSWITPCGPQEVAIKMLKQDTRPAARVKLLQEATIMGQFCHPHIVKLFGAVTLDEPLMLALEYLDGGDLQNYLRGCVPNGHTLPRLLLAFCRDIADGMKYLSNKGFVHRDLAARNILLDKNLKCKIADFGLSRDLDCSEYYVSMGGKIAVKWTAPEAILNRKYSTSSDVWSYGMMMYEIWSLGHKPFPNLTVQEVIVCFKSHPGYVQPPPPGCPRKIYEIMISCWNYDYHNRPKFTSITEQLNRPSESVLKIPAEHLECVGNPDDASQLGQDLQSAFDLYLDLQTKYQ